MTDVAREAATGSSPLARGLRLAGRDGHPHAGIIPARAGFTGASKRNWRPRGDHPRSRGVYRHDGGAEDATRGSSPLARGLRGDPVVFGGGAGIIPARAGFTIGLRAGARGCRDHPRSRGVYSMACRTAARSIGSSPLARGLHPLDSPSPGEYRIIPARAGFTIPARRPRKSAWDHPRSRGVYPRSARSPVARSGSSPLARGLLALLYRYKPSPGIIPARAGFTLSILSTHLHPGSSPLARGLLRRDLALFRGRRIIPARAGFTTPWS